MKKLIYINACIRGENSRTKTIAMPILEKLGKTYEIDELDLTTAELSALNALSYKDREAGIHTPIALDFAKKLASADKIVIAMPFWDMSFPAVFKVFCECVTINGITFKEYEDGRLEGLCIADKIMLITTRGAEIEDFSPMEQATSYIKAISWLWGVGDLVVVSAIGMDACDDETRKQRIQKATQRGLELCDSF